MGQPGYLWVDVSINSAPKGNMLIMIGSSAQEIWAASDRLDELGVNSRGTQVVRSMDGQLFTALHAIAGLQTELDERNARLDLRVDPASLPLNSLNARSRQIGAAQRGRGFHLNYDLLASSFELNGLDQVNGFSEQLFYNAHGSFRNTLRVTQGSEIGSNWARLETFWLKDFTGSASRLQVGDLLSASDLFGRRYRMAGVRWSREFSIRPLEPQYDAPEFYGVSEVPSNVELFIDGVRRARLQTSAGPFRIEQAPVLTGAGVASLVLTNVVGESIVKTIQYYVDPSLLKAGLWDYDFSLGWLRQAYGVESFDYGAPNAVAAIRYGVNRKLTLEWNGHYSKELSSSELRFRFKVFELPMTATTGMGIQLAQSGGPSVLGRIGSSYRHRAFFANLEASLVDARAATEGVLPFTRQIVGGAGFRVRKWQTSYNLLHRRKSAVDSFTRHGIRVSRSERYSFGFIGVAATYSRTLDSANFKDDALQFTVSWTPNSEHFISIRDQQLSDHKLESSYRYRTLDELGFSASINQLYSNQQSQVRAGIQKNYSNWQVRGQLDSRSGSAAESMQLGVRGALGLMQGQFFSARALGSAYALVDLSGQPEVPVYMNHKMVVKSDARGLAVLPNLLPYEENKVTINPLDFRLSVFPEDDDLITVPGANTGLYMKFDIRESRAFELNLMQAPAIPVPAGAVIVNDFSHHRFYVGDGGRSYIEQDAEQLSYQVYWRGQSCRFTINMNDLPADSLQPDMGHVLCR